MTETTTKPRAKAGRKPAPKATYKRKEAVLLPELSIADMKVGQTVAVSLQEEMGDKETVRAYDLATKEHCKLTGLDPIRAAINARGKHEGLAFEIIRGRKAGRTNEYSVYEIEE